MTTFDGGSALIQDVVKYFLNNNPSYSVYWRYDIDYDCVVYQLFKNGVQFSKRIRWADIRELNISEQTAAILDILEEAKAGILRICS